MICTVVKNCHTGCWFFKTYHPPRILRSMYRRGTWCVSTSTPYCGVIKTYNRSNCWTFSICPGSCFGLLFTIILPSWVCNKCDMNTADRFLDFLLYSLHIQASFLYTIFSSSFTQNIGALFILVDHLLWERYIIGILFISFLHYPFPPNRYFIRSPAKYPL